VRVLECFRSIARQDALYAKGRTALENPASTRERQRGARSLAVTSALAAGGTGAPHGDELAYAKRAALECDALAADKHSRTVKLIEVDLDSDSPRWERVAAGSDQEVGASLTVRLKNERVRVAESHRPAPSVTGIAREVLLSGRRQAGCAPVGAEDVPGDVVVRHSRYFGLSVKRSRTLGQSST